MGLETTTTIAGLVETNPIPGDGVNEGDNHLILLKTVLKNIFPGSGGIGFATPIIATEAELNYMSGVTGGIQAQIDINIAGIATKANSGANSDITSLSGLSTALTVPQGGTGANTHTTNAILLGNGASAISELPLGAALYHVRVNAAGTELEFAALPIDDYIKLSDVKSNGTGGGASSAAAQNVRTLNTEIDAGGHCILAANLFTLDAGIYDIDASSPAHGVNNHKIRLYNVSDLSIEIIGTSEHSSSSVNVQTRSFISGRFEIASAKQFRIDHYTQTAKTINGLGISTNSGDSEIYTIVELWKVG